MSSSSSSTPNQPNYYVHPRLLISESVERGMAIIILTLWQLRIFHAFGANVNLNWILPKLEPCVIQIIEFTRILDPTSFQDVPVILILINSSSFNKTGAEGFEWQAFKVRSIRCMSTFLILKRSQNPDAEFKAIRLAHIVPQDIYARRKVVIYPKSYYIVNYNDRNSFPNEFSSMDQSEMLSYFRTSSIPPVFLLLYSKAGILRAVSIFCWYRNSWSENLAKNMFSCKCQNIKTCFHDIQNCYETIIAQGRNDILELNKNDFTFFILLRESHACRADPSDNDNNVKHIRMLEQEWNFCRIAYLKSMQVRIDEFPFKEDSTAAQAGRLKKKIHGWCLNQIGELLINLNSSTKVAIVTTVDKFDLHWNFLLNKVRELNLGLVFASNRRFRHDTWHDINGYQISKGLNAYHRWLPNRFKILIQSGIYSFWEMMKTYQLQIQKEYLPYTYSRFFQSLSFQNSSVHLLFYVWLAGAAVAGAAVLFEIQNRDKLRR
ncbi:unnamed protein product [Allacma fusca]|uniref:Uncharacterized protein n=1 Tax=Allacma fusca TaxID=39272 RepID=A0A8J2LSH3_9HEXA|nr:unnamed protein product [Allacma fusca]